MNKYDVKKEYKMLFPGKTNPTIVKVPKFTYIAIKGKGNPNEEGGEYKKALEKLYAIVWTIKMSKMKENPIANYQEYVMPPLDGFWWGEDEAFDFTKKDDFHWISAILQPDFVNEEVLLWAKQEVLVNKGMDAEDVYLFNYEEKDCVQCLHIGSYDEEATTTIPKMQEYATEQGYVMAIGNERYHHEIYLGDPRKCEPAKLKTIIRIPIKEK